MDRKIVSINKGRQLYEILRRDILQGKYAQGDKLPSIRELSQVYGLSKNTVNTVFAMLTNDRLCYVSEGNGTFVGSRQEEPRLLGVMMIDFQIEARVESDILKHIQLNLPTDYYLTLMNAPNRYDDFLEALQVMENSHPAGYIISLPKAEPTASELKRAVSIISGRPSVMINRALPGLNADTYSMDLKKGIAKAFEYLVISGKKNIAVLLHDTEKFLQEEKAAYAQCCHLYGYTPREDLLIDSSSDIEEIRDRVSGILPRIDALIGSDFVLYQLNDLLCRSGKEIPRELSLVGINDTIYTRMFNPPLTSIVFPVERIGRHAVGKLIRRIEGEEKGAFKTVNFEPELIIRST